MAKKKEETLPAVTDDSRKRRQLLKVAAILSSGGVSTADGAVKGPVDVASRQVEIESDSFTSFYSKYHLLQPAYSFSNLYKFYEESDVLQTCIDAFIQNVDGFGYMLQFLGDDTKDRDSKPALTEYNKLTEFFNKVNDRQSFRTVRKEFRKELEIIGISGFEFIRNLNHEITMIYHAKFLNLRMTSRDTIPTEVEASVRRNGKTVKITVKKYFRRFAQVDIGGKTIVWFKEFGDPRHMDKTTGTYYDSPKKCKGGLASEILYIKNDVGNEPYGLPRWIGSILQVLGRRNAQYVNYDLFESQGIPPMAIMVSGGILNDASIEELEAAVQSMRGVGNFNKILVLESVPQSTGLDDKGTAKIDMKNLTEFRKEDQMFKDFMATAKNDVRESYRMPDLYIGQNSNYCVDDVTETLTENGWKKYWEVTPGEKIATFNPDTSMIEYHVPENDGKPFVFDFNGDLIHFKNDAVDFACTPQHKMWFGSYRYQPQMTWEKAKASRLVEFLENGNLAYFSIMDEELSFAVAGVGNEDVSLLPYKGKVYCFEVKNHLFITRRNGKIGIHSNTHSTAKASQRVAEEQVFIPEREDFDEIVNTLLVGNEFNCHLWKYASKGPRIVGASEVSDGVEVFGKSGAFTINNAIEQANAAFSTQMSKFDKPWANYPFPLVLEMIKQGRLVIDELVTEVLPPVKPDTEVVPDVDTAPEDPEIASGMDDNEIITKMAKIVGKPDEIEKLVAVLQALLNQAREGEGDATTITE